MAKDPKKEYVAPIPNYKKKSVSDVQSVDSDNNDEDDENEATNDEPTVPLSKETGKAKMPPPQPKQPPQPQRKKPSSILFKEPFVDLPNTKTSKAFTSTSKTTSKATSKPIRPSPSKTTHPVKTTKTTPKPTKSSPSTVQGEKSKKKDHSRSPPLKPQKKSKSNISPPLSPTFTPETSPVHNDREEEAPPPKATPKPVKKPLQLVDEPPDEEDEAIGSSESGDEVEIVKNVETVEKDVDVSTPDFSDDDKDDAADANVIVGEVEKDKDNE